MKSTPSSLASFHWHNATQFLGALNDNLFKLLIIYGLIQVWPDRTVDTTLAIVGLTFALPFLLFLGVGGVLADRYPKHRVIRATKFAEIVIMGIGVIGFSLQSAPLMLATVFLMSTQSACFGPSKYGIIPELVGKGGLSRANSFLQAAAYFAIILGTALAPEISLLTGKEGSVAAIFCVAIAALGYLSSRQIPVTTAAGQTRKASWFVLKDVARGLRDVHRDGFLTLAVWGSAVFSFVGAYLQMNLLAYGESVLGLSPEGATRLFFATAIGIGIGSLLAGKLGRKGIEVGTVPVGTVLMLVSSLGFFTLDATANPTVGNAAVLSVLLGIGAGLFVVPVEAFIQYRTPGDRLGKIIAASAWLSWAGVLLAAVVLLLNTSVLGLSPAEGFVFLAVVLALMTTVAMIALPDFFARFMAFIVTRTIYRVRATGIENLPAHGPALLVANHVSVMDAVWLLAIQPRRIRFIASREAIQRNHPFIRFFLKLGKVIPIEETDGPKALVRSLQTARQALQDGFIVGIFPEGKLSRTGHLLPFKRGFEKIVKGLDCPVIPAWIDGGYDSHAGLGHDHDPRPLDLRDWGHPVTIAVGPPLPSDATPEAVRDAVEASALAASRTRIESDGPAAVQWIRSARRNWRKLAIREATEGKSLTYGRTLIGSYILRNRLRRILSPSETNIGILVPPSAGGALANLALTLDGRTCVNLNYTAPETAQKAALEQASIHTVVTSRRVVEKIPGLVLPRKTVFLEDLGSPLSSFQKLLAWATCRFAPIRTVLRGGLPVDHIDQTHAILFSSGSTSTPKGIELSHANIFGNINAFGSIGRFRSDDRILGVLPFFHSMGFTITLWFPLTRGLSVAYHSNPLEASRIGKLATDFQPTVALATPSILLGWTRKMPAESFSSVRWLIAGAEKLRPSIAQRIESHFGVPALEGYGCTECSPVVAVNVPDIDRDGYCQPGTSSGSVGRPLPGVRIRIINPDTEEAVTPGTPGMIEVHGPNVMKGYCNNPAATRDVISAGWYRTGDLGYLDADRFLHITDRVSRFSKIAGEMVSHAAVEEALSNALDLEPNLLAVTTVADDRKGERLIVIYAREAGICARRIGEALRKVSLPNLWKPHPQSWLPVEALPLLGSGKLDLGKLRQIAQSQV